MKKFKKTLCVLLSFVLCVSFTFGSKAYAVSETVSGDSDASSDTRGVDATDTYSFEDKSRGVEVSIHKTDEWKGGYTAEVALKNTGSDALTNWHITLKSGNTIDSVWNAEYKVEDKTVTFSYPTWKRKIEREETYTFGMQLKGSFGDFSDFSDFTYYEDGKDVSSLYSVDYVVDSTWDGHAIIRAIITNTGETTLRDWSLTFDYDAEIVDLWDANVVSEENGSYRLKNKEYNADIESGKSVSFGFQAQYEGDEVVLPTNSKLIAIADSKLVPVETDRVDWYKTMTKADSIETLRMRDSVKDVVKVAIIDSGVDYFGEGDEISRVDFINDTDEENPLYDDRSGHGTGVGGMLVGVGKKAEEEEETTEAEASDVDFSYLTDADYIEPVDVEDDEKFDEDITDEDDYSEEDYDDYDDEDYDVEDNDGESYEEAEDDTEASDNDVIDDSDDSDESDDEADIDDDLNLFEYNDLYGDI